MRTAQRSEGTACARAALAGNPSDGYGGAVLAVTLPSWRAWAQAGPAQTGGVEPSSPLVQATVERFAREFGPAGGASAVRWSTSIPQRVGLGSSSALVIAVARALCERHGVDLAPARLADFALGVETEGLGIVAGLQDRVAQAYEGLTFMAFSDPPQYERLDPGLLPPLVIAWREAAAADSGHVHEELRARHRRGDPTVRQAMVELADTARAARDALLDRDLAGFRECVDRSFDLRRSSMPLDPSCVEMIETARACGASANYTGSGGAIVAACTGQAHPEEVERALSKIGCGVARA